MAILSNIKINVDRCNKGIYLRWYHSQGGWHYQLVKTKIEGELKSTNKDVKTDVDFSLLSKVQSLTGKDFAVTYNCGLIGLNASQKDAIVGMLECETVQWYRDGVWQDIDVNRGSFSIKRARGAAFNIEFSFEVENYLEDV